MTINFKLQLSSLTLFTSILELDMNKIIYYKLPNIVFKLNLLSSKYLDALDELFLHDYIRGFKILYLQNNLF